MHGHVSAAPLSIALSTSRFRCRNTRIIDAYLLLRSPLLFSLMKQEELVRLDLRFRALIQCPGVTFPVNTNDHFQFSTALLSSLFTLQYLKSQPTFQARLAFSARKH